MLSPLLNESVPGAYSGRPDSQDGAGLARSRFFRPILASVVVVQLIAFYMLCSHQMRKAEVRGTAVQVQQMAINDCLQYVPDSTIASCAARVAPLNPDGSIPKADTPSALSSDAPRGSKGSGVDGSPRSSLAASTVPVRFSYR